MQTQEKTKIIALPHPWKIFALESFLFSLTLGLGIATAFKINKILTIERITPPQISPLKFITYFLGVTLFIFFLSYVLKLKKEKGLIFKTLFILAIFSGSITLFSAWLPDETSFVLIIILLFWWVKWPSIFIQDLLVVFGIAGAGSFLGLALDPLVVVLLLIIFSIYDWIAVFKTKHMIKMAREMIESRAVLALVVPPDISSFKEGFKEIRPGGKFLILGGGDIVFPLLFVASLVPFGVLKSLIVAFFSLLGLLASFLFFISQKRRQPIPALPPIAFFSIIGYLITLFI